VKIVLINICLRPEVEKRIFPVGLGYVASAIHRAGHELEIIDMDAHRQSFEDVEQHLENIPFDAVGFGCIVTGYHLIKRLAKIVKKINENAWVIAGNSVATAIPDILLKNTDVDIASMGESDVTIVDLLNCLDSGRDLGMVKGICYKDDDGETHETSPRSVIADIDDIALPEWDLFDMKTYVDMSKQYVSEPYPRPFDEIRAFAVNTARGCPYHCTFCYHVFRGCRYRIRTPSSIVHEIRVLQEKYKINYINFWDELTLFSLTQTHELVSAIIDSGLKFDWTGSCRGNLFNLKDIELLKLMKASGCIGLGYSLESANKKILKSMNKKLDPTDFAKQKMALDTAGIISWTSLVIGYPEETEETIKETFDFCYENDIYPSAGYLLPQPNTPIYEYAIENGFIQDKEAYLLDMGDRQDLRINLTGIPQDRLEGLVNSHLARIRDKLELDLSDEQLIKTGKYRAKKQ
jgi:anaerobic magnesium-protoporphyrin IX monomethyl ester cyclase